MWRPESQPGPGSPDCPDLLQHVPALRSPVTPLYLSFFEEECRAIVTQLRRGAAAEPSPGPGELSGLQPKPPGPATSTPLPLPSHGRLPDSSAGDCKAAAAPGPAPAPGEPGSLPQPAAGGSPGARPARKPAVSRRARRGPELPSGGGPGTPARSPAPAPLARSAAPSCRLALPRARASLGLQLPAAGTGRGAWETRLLRPPGTRLKLTSPARSRLPRASGASQQAQPSSLPRLAPRARAVKSNSAPARCLARSREAPAAKVGSCKQPSSKLSTGIPTVASCSSLRPPEKVISFKRFGLNRESTTEELVCNRTRELKENDESKERLVAASIDLGASRNDQTWEYEKSSLSSELAPGLTSGGEDAFPAEQSAGDQLSQELERVKKELERVKKVLERVKGELADKTAQCEAYEQTIRAAGMFPHCGEPSLLGRLQGCSSGPLRAVRWEGYSSWPLPGVRG
ncbi:nascent polypeptide-associated complex subunit alpha, muscle-specific form-like [Melospiza melodia melodia]|uniref:nascent polypeptide-associated complex subunit alpha, muscle-specific form-like n=1 Tax=Melospiza melodia melodia TaxID=1914991 RepID=UPI002FCE7858